MDIQHDILNQYPPTPNPYPGAFSDFRGLPSNPKCIFRTGNDWPVRSGFEAQPILREARPICVHPIQEGGEAGPLHLWVGVNPGSLSFEDAKAAAEGCKKILTDANFFDIEIAFRESIFTRSVGPRLLNYSPNQSPITQITCPFTPTLGIRIAPLKAPHLEGSGALYLCENSQSQRVFILTARHVVLPPSEHQNKLYTRSNSGHRAAGKPAENIIILGNQAYTDALQDMTDEIKYQSSSIGIYRSEIDGLGEPADDEDTDITSARQKWQEELTRAEETRSNINALHSKIKQNWTAPDQRVLGYVCHAPPISFGTGFEQFTEDWALIDLDRGKIDWDRFKGNVINLGDRISKKDFNRKMHPHPLGRSSFKFPADGLLKVSGVIGEVDLRQPKQLDADGEACILVIKNGKTNVTLGRGTSLESVIRTIDKYNMKGTSREFAIYSYSRKDGPFSAPGDSGSMVVDGVGRIVGLLTSGTGATDSTDVTYVTPYYWLEKRIKSAFPDSHLYPMAN